jgi:hypothetical protein
MIRRKKGASRLQECRKEMEREGLYHPALVKAFAIAVIEGIMVTGISMHKNRSYNSLQKYIIFMFLGNIAIFLI